MILKQMLQQKAEIEAAIAEQKERLEFVMEEIGSYLADNIKTMRDMQAKEFGAVNFEVSGVKVTHTVPKKVKWDQVKMGEIFQKILESGDKPSNYMKATLEVPEKMYADFGDEVKSIFAQARTVEYGKPSWKFEEVV